MAPQNDIPAPGTRNHSLDVLRGIAVLMVLILHSTLSPELTRWLGGHPAGKFMLDVIKLGPYGVDLFFILSGFLISSALLKEVQRTGSIRCGRFWMRRGFKIWPSYFASYGSVLVVTCAVAFFSNKQHWKAIWNALASAWPNFFFIQNYVHYEHRWFASWSLAIEEQFYIALPLLLIAWSFFSRRPGILIGGTITLWTASMLMRWHSARIGTDPASVYIQTHLHLDGFCVGILLGYAHLNRPQWFRKLPGSVWLAAAVLALSLAAGFAKANIIVPPSLASLQLFIGFGLLVAICIAHPNLGLSTPCGGFFRFLGTLGTYSYTIYIAQTIALTVVMSAWFRRHLVQPYPWLESYALAFLVISLGMGILLFHAVERPFLKLRDTVLSRRPASAKGSEPTPSEKSITATQT